MHGLILSLVLGAGLLEPAECRDPPSRASDGYWDYIDACGCASLDPPSKASADYDRFLKACSRWRERNPKTTVVVSKTPGTDPVPPAAETARPSPECRNPPSRASSSYWDYIEACGCESVDPPSKASDDYSRYLKACSEWRERNPKVEVVVPSDAPSPPAP
jgi:hypothetical protein